MRLSMVCRAARYLVSPKLIYVSKAHSLHSGTRPLSCLVSQSQDHPWVTLDRKLVFHRNFIRTSMSQTRQNFPEECEAGLNRQINLELYSSYVYSSMAFHFDRDDVALPGFHKFFKKQSDEEREHAEKLMKYQNMRGGRVLLQDIRKPEVDEWGSGLEAMTSALKLEKSVNQSLLDLHNVAESKGDTQFGDFLEDEFLKEQIASIKQIGDYVTQLTRVGPGLGEYMFDKETLQETE